MLPAAHDTHAHATFSDDSHASGADAAAVAIQIELAKDTNAASAAPNTELETGEANNKAWTTKRIVWLCVSAVVAITAVLGIRYIYQSIQSKTDTNASDIIDPFEHIMHGNMGSDQSFDAIDDEFIYLHRTNYIMVSRPDFEKMRAFVAATKFTCRPTESFDVFQLYSTENASYYQKLVPDNESNSSSSSANVSAAPINCKLSDQTFYYYTTAMVLARDIAQCNGDIKKSMFAPYVEQYTQSDSDLCNKILAIIYELLSVNVMRNANRAILSAHQLNNVCYLSAINSIFDLFKKTADSENRISDTVTVKTLKTSSIMLYKTLPDTVQSIGFVDFVVRYIVEIAFTIYHIEQHSANLKKRDGHLAVPCEAFLAREFDHVTGTVPLESVQGYLVNGKYDDSIAFSTFVKNLKDGDGLVAKLHCATLDLKVSEADEIRH